MDLILGIDFGTTNTVITYFKNNKPNILLDGVFKSIKSKIGIKDDIYTCGNYISLNNDKIIHSFKTDIGNNDIDKILIIFFNHLKKVINKQFQDYNLKAVITVPSNFNDLQREIIQKNFINVGFNILRIINEPSAAALSYGLDSSCLDEEKILVLDIGGGTLDLTLLLKENGFFEVIHSIGLNDLGGNDITRVIYEFILKLYPDFDDKKLNQLWYSCQNAKEKLSWLEDYEIKINLYNNKSDLSFNLNVKKFENLCYPLIIRLEQVLFDIKKIYDDIKYIILVGNSSKIPFIKVTIEKILDIKPWLHPNLDSVVSEGACLYGAILEKVYKSDKSVILVDVLPLSLGIETADGNFSIIIPKNTPLPIKRTQRYITDSPSTKSVIIKVYQGERLIANKNTLIGEFNFDKLTLGSNGTHIDITFKVDLNSIITVNILDKKSDLETNILIKNMHIFNQDEINNIINNASTNNLIDEEEMIKQSRIYLINSKIEISMNNIKLNHLITEDNKKELLKELTILEAKIELADNIILLHILKELDDKFLNWTQNNIDTQDIINNNEIEKIMIIELKDELYNKVIFLLDKNPDWLEYLQPIIDKLTLSNISLEYIHEKLEIIKELEDDQVIDHKMEFNNTCLFIKNQIEEEKIELPPEKLDALIQLINKSLLLLESDECDWKLELYYFNNQCYIINN